MKEFTLKSKRIKGTSNGELLVLFVVMFLSFTLGLPLLFEGCQIGGGNRDLPGEIISPFPVPGEGANSRPAIDPETGETDVARDESIAHAWGIAAEVAGCLESCNQAHIFIAVHPSGKEERVHFLPWGEVVAGMPNDPKLRRGVVQSFLADWIQKRLKGGVTTFRLIHQEGEPENPSGHHSA